MNRRAFLLSLPLAVVAAKAVARQPLAVVEPGTYARDVELWDVPEGFQFLDPDGYFMVTDMDYATKTVTLEPIHASDMTTIYSRGRAVKPTSLLRHKHRRHPRKRARKG